MSILTVVLTVHSVVRYLILLVAVTGLIITAIVMDRRGQYSRGLAALASTYSGLLDLQVLLGLILLVGMGVAEGKWTPYSFLHGFLGLLAAGTGHLPAMWGALQDRPRLARGLIVYAATLVLLLLAIPIALYAVQATS
jgi:hypothetical protein